MPLPPEPFLPTPPAASTVPPEMATRSKLKMPLPPSPSSLSPPLALTVPPETVTPP